MDREINNQEFIYSADDDDYKTFCDIFDKLVKERYLTIHHYNFEFDKTFKTITENSRLPLLFKTSNLVDFIYITYSYYCDKY